MFHHCNNNGLAGDEILFHSLAGPLLSDRYQQINHRCCQYFRFVKEHFVILTKLKKQVVAVA